MRPQDAENLSQEHYGLDEREDESSLPWFDEEEIVSREYGEDDPWIDEG